MDRVKHYKIIRSDTGKFFISARSSFETLQDLVNYYQYHLQAETHHLCGNLINPCNKPQFISPPKPAYAYEIDISTIRFGERMTESEFCIVWQGVWNEVTPVTIKKKQTSNND